MANRYLNNLARPALLGLGIASSPVTAQAQAALPAAAYVAAFTETCLKGFPNVDAVAASAAAGGWQELNMRAIGPEPKELVGTRQRTFQRNGMMLFLSQPTSGPFKSLCQVASAGRAQVTHAELVASVTPLFRETAPVADKVRGNEGTLWTIGPDRDVRASVSGSRSTTTVSLIARQKR